MIPQGKLQHECAIFLETYFESGYVDRGTYPSEAVLVGVGGDPFALSEYLKMAVSKLFRQQRHFFSSGGLFLQF